MTGGSLSLDEAEQLVEARLGASPGAALQRTSGLADVVGERPFLMEIIAGTAQQHGVTLATLASLLAGLPRKE